MMGLFHNVKNGWRTRKDDTIAGILKAQPEIAIKQLENAKNKGWLKKETADHYIKQVKEAQAQALKEQEEKNEIERKSD